MEWEADLVGTSAVGARGRKGRHGTNWLAQQIVYDAKPNDIPSSGPRSRFCACCASSPLIRRDGRKYQKRRKALRMSGSRVASARMGQGEGVAETAEAWEEVLENIQALPGRDQSIQVRGTVVSEPTDLRGCLEEERAELRWRELRRVDVELGRWPPSPLLGPASESSRMEYTEWNECSDASNDIRD
ncbi:hypothetical protein B0H13DRAFT_1989696 [Mycena leptocephala]|nr:hypothetical protein B0H13DRAFT_1989696 [Mycena leptocephala]